MVHYCSGVGIFHYDHLASRGVWIVLWHGVQQTHVKQYRHGLGRPDRRAPLVHDHAVPDQDHSLVDAAQKNPLTEEPQENPGVLFFAHYNEIFHMAKKIMDGTIWNEKREPS